MSGLLGRYTAGSLEERVVEFVQGLLGSPAGEGYDSESEMAFAALVALAGVYADAGRADAAASAWDAEGRPFGVVRDRRWAVELDSALLAVAENLEVS